MVSTLMIWSAATSIAAAGVQAQRSVADLQVLTPDEHAQHLARRDERLAKHYAQRETWVRNSAKEEHAAAHAAVMASAVEMENAAVAKRKRADAANGGSTGLVDVYSYGTDITYLANCSIGTPGQTFSIIPDTGSADLWVPDASANDPGHAEFTSSASSSYVGYRNDFNITYGIGWAAGHIAQDTVSMAGFTVQKQLMGLATSVDAQSAQSANDGIMGLASGQIGDTTNVTFFENLLLDKQINNPYFSVFLTRGRDAGASGNAYVDGSSLCIGCIATPTNAQTSGSLFYVPVEPAFTWYEVRVQGISLNGQQISSTATYAIVDTGTTALYLPVAVANAMVASVNGRQLSDGSYIVPVGDISTSTQFAFNFNGGNINVNVLDLISGYADNARQYYLLNVYGEDIPGSGNELIGILGDVFIKNALTVFSYSQNGAPAVGFQQLTSSGSSTSVGVVTATPMETPVTTGRRTRTGGFTATSAIAGPTSTAAARRAVSAGAGAGSGLLGAVLGLVGIGGGMLLVL